MAMRVLAPPILLLALALVFLAAGLAGARSSSSGVGVELWKRLQYLGGGKLHYLRTKAGAEVDFIVARGGPLVPIEVKWTEHPSLGDARHLLTFLDEHPRRARHGYLICRCSEPLALDRRVTALPWSFL